MKKGILTMLALLVLTLVWQAPEAKAATKWSYKKDAIVETQGVYTYHAYVSKDNKKCWIYWIEIDTAKVKQAKELSIPAKLQGKKVTRLGYDYPEDDPDAEFNDNIFGITVEVAHECDGYSGLLRYLKKITIPNTVTEIEATCFSGVDYVKTIKLPSKVKKLYGETFYGCDRLQKVVLPKQLKSIVPEAFQDCPKLKSVKLSKANKKYSLKKGILFEKKTKKAIWALPTMKKVTIPNGVKTIGSGMLASGNATKVHIPASVQKVEGLAFENIGIKKITVDSKSEYLGVDGQCVYHKKDHSLVVAMPDTAGYFRISDKVTLLQSETSVAGGEIDVLIVPASVKQVELSGLQLARYGLYEKVYFLGEQPPTILEKAEGYASLPIFTDVYVKKGALATYKAWYKEYDCYDYVDLWSTFEEKDLKK